MSRPPSHRPRLRTAPRGRAGARGTRPARPASLRGGALPAALVLLLLACGGPPRATPPLDPFWLAAFRSESFHGSPLSGPVPPPAAVPDPADLLVVEVEVHHVPTRPRRVMQPFSRLAGIAAQDTGTMGFVPALTLPRDALIGFGDEASDFLQRLHDGEWGRLTRLADGTTALATDMTFCLLAAPADTPPVVPAHGALPPGPQVGEIELYRPADRDGQPTPLQLALVHPLAVESLARLTPATARDAARLLVELPAGTREAAVVVPVTETPRLGGALVFRFSVRPPPSPPDALHRAAAATLLASSAEAAASVRLMRVGPGSVEAFVLQTAISRISRPAARRNALLFLANELDAPVAADLALHGDHELLVGLAANVRATLERRSDLAPDELGWVLERAAWTMIEEHRNDEARALALEALLTVHAGEVGRVGGRILDLVDAAETRAQFTDALVRANLDHLRDRDPGSRVRAFDWLAARGAAPAGYDPLAPGSEREAALQETHGEAVEGDPEAVR